MLDKMNKLIKELNKASELYYNGYDTIITDSEWDSKFDELKKLEQLTGIIMANSPSVNVGSAIVTELQKVSHTTPLKSLNKTKDVKELQKFLKIQDGVLMLKADGLTNKLIYKNGKFIEGSTRGNGIIGENITHNIKTYTNVPLNIECKKNIEVIGEAIISLDVFEKININGKYKNPRNLTAGSVRQLDSDICKSRQVKFIAYGVNGIEFETKIDQLNWLKEQGFQVIPHKFINYKECVAETIQEVKSLASNNIPIDGLVLTFNDLGYGSKLGETEHHPLHSMAFKFKDDVEETTLTDMEWNVGRTGVITPIAIFNPIELEGTVVKRASVHNVSEVKRLGLYINCNINVYKANQIIPQIQNVVDKTQGRIIDIPKICPTCGGETIITESEQAEFLYCSNYNCSAKLIQRIVHFCSKNAMNIEGLSEKTIEKFIEKGFIKEIADIYNSLELYKDDIVKMDGFGVKSYNKLIKSINNSKKCKLSNLFFALGIPNVGKTTAKTLVDFAPGILPYEKIRDIKDMQICDFMRMKDCGGIVANSIYSWFSNNENILMLNKLLKHIEFIEDDKISVSEGVFSGLIVYATGTFENFKKKEVQNIIESCGGTMANGYLKSLDILIVGSKKGSSKVDKARKDGVKIMSEEELINLKK